MTTIAWDGRTLVADTRAVRCGMPAFVTKAWRLADGRLFGGSGQLGDALAIYRWMNEGGPKPAKVEDFSGLLITRASEGVRIELMDDTLQWFPIRATCWAIGSGRDFAIAAMALGKNAQAAVELAAEFDLYTGLPWVAFVLD